MCPRQTYAAAAALAAALALAAGNAAASTPSASGDDDFAQTISAALAPDGFQSTISCLKADAAAATAEYQADGFGGGGGHAGGGGRTGGGGGGERPGPSRPSEPGCT